MTNEINTVRLNGEVKHITELDDLTLCNEWSKLIKENNRLYEINREVSRGWRGFILKLIGINLPDKRTVFIKGINSKGESIRQYTAKAGQARSVTALIMLAHRQVER